MTLEQIIALAGFVLLVGGLAVGYGRIVAITAENARRIRRLERHDSERVRPLRPEDDEEA